MRRLLLALMATSAMAQTAGTISTTTVSTITAAAGAVSCTFTSQVPALPSGVTIACRAGTAALDQASVVPAGNTSGIVGSFHVGADAVTWMLKQVAAGGVSWEISANGATQKGTF
jgi:hypothetical protein